MNKGNDTRRAWKNLFWIVVAFAIGLLLTSCHTVEYVTVEKVRTDTTYITKQQRDSIWLHDSIHISEKGDTVRIERWHTKYIERATHDTTYVATHDTIPQPFPVIKEVERQLTWWQKARMTLGTVLLVSVCLGIAFSLVRRKIGL